MLEWCITQTAAPFLYVGYRTLHTYNFVTDTNSPFIASLLWVYTHLPSR